MATIETDSIIQQLKYKLDPIPGVLEVEPKVNAKRDKVQATVDVEVSAGVNVPEQAGQLMNVVQSVLADDLGCRSTASQRFASRWRSLRGGRRPCSLSRALGLSLSRNRLSLNRRLRNLQRRHRIGSVGVLRRRKETSRSRERFI